jgi:hypothetical protein
MSLGYTLTPPEMIMSLLRDFRERLVNHEATPPPRPSLTVHLTEAYHGFTALRAPVYIKRTVQRADDLGLTFTEPPGADE